MKEILERVQSLNAKGPGHKNCCQSVLMGLSEPMGLDQELAARVGTCFGGGMMNAEVCGALSGAMMYLGLKYGNSPETKQQGREFINRFRKEFGSIVCREILDPATGRKDCAGLVLRTVELMLEYEKETGGNGNACKG